jgi:hypothetical protein
MHLVEGRHRNDTSDSNNISINSNYNSDSNSNSSLNIDRFLLARSSSVVLERAHNICGVYKHKLHAMRTVMPWLGFEDPEERPRRQRSAYKLVILELFCRSNKGAWFSFYFILFYFNL